MTEIAILVQLNSQYYAAQIMNGVVLGMTYVLIAIGLSLIFGTMGIINFAHGDMLLLGTYVAWWSATQLESHIIGFILAPLSVIILGVVIEFIGLRRTYDRSPLLQLLLTFGIAEMLRQSIQFIWGRTAKSFPNPSWATGTVSIGSFSYSSYRLFVIFSTVAILAGLYWFLKKTDVGIIIRAGTEDREMVNMLGINIYLVFTIVFAVGAGLAGVAGALIGPIRNATPLLGVNLLIPSFVVVIVGGVGSYIGTVISGLAIGIIVVLTGVVAPQFSNIVIFIIMAAVLLARPQGLFGEEGVLQ